MFQVTFWNGNYSDKNVLIKSRLLGTSKRKVVSGKGRKYTETDIS